MARVTRILVPPGIGDVYWVMVKLRGFMRAHGIEDAEIWVDSPNDRRRAAGFVERVPFVTFGGYHERGPRRRSPNDVWRRGVQFDPVRAEAYLRDGRHAFPGVDGFDWFLSFNGSLNAGRSLDEVEPDWPAEWELELKQLGEEAYYGAYLRRQIGPYIATAFFDGGFYKRWLSELPPKTIGDMLQSLAEMTGNKIVLTGASWDDSPLNRHLSAQLGELAHSLVGQTSIDQLFGVLRFADGCIGFPAGNTMMSVVLDRPTVLIWNDFFPEAMHRNALPPSSLGRNYLPLNSRVGAAEIAGRAAALINLGVDR